MAELNFEKLKASSAATIFCVISTIPIGFAYIFYFDSGLFYSIEFLKLLFLASAITLPLVLFQALSFLFAEFGLEDFSSGNTQKVNSAIIYGSIISSVMLLLTLILAYFLQEQLKFGIIFLLILQILFFVIHMANGVKTKRKKSINKQ